MSATARATKVKRIQRKRTKGYKLPERTLCVSRPSVFGNTYSVAEFGELALPLFRNTARGVWNPALLDGKPEALRLRAYDLHHAWLKRFGNRHPLDAFREALKGMDSIACWCREDAECHGDTWLELA